MAFACCESCGNALDDPGVLRYGRPAGECPDCGGTMTWMATPFANRVLTHRLEEASPFAPARAPSARSMDERRIAL
jgi:hypothetical protein